MKMKTRAAAERLGVSEATLEKWRVAGRGPRFVKIGRRAVFYEEDDLDAFIEAGRRISTSQSAPADPASDNHPRRDRRAWRNGYDAGFRGPATCPYPLGTPEAWSWAAGLIEGMAAARPAGNETRPALAAK